MLIQSFGIRQITSDSRAVAPSVGLGEDALAAEISLPEYIEKQKQLIGKALKEPAFAGPQPVVFQGADEALLLLVRHQLQSAASMTHFQTYVRLGLWLGIVTFTALHDAIPAVRPDYDIFVRGLRIAPATAAQPNTAKPGLPGGRQPAA